MEETKQMHDVNVEWGCITNLMDRISNIEEKMDGGWPELIDMVADAVSEEGEKKDPVEAFFALYQFLFRLYYRLKANPVKQPFDKYIDQGDCFWIQNYSFALHRWAIKNGFATEIDNLVIKIPKDKLNDKQRRALERRCK